MQYILTEEELIKLRNESKQDELEKAYKELERVKEERNKLASIIVNAENLRAIDDIMAMKKKISMTIDLQELPQEILKLISKRLDRIEGYLL